LQARQAFLGGACAVRQERDCKRVELEQLKHQDMPSSQNSEMAASENPALGRTALYHDLVFLDADRATRLGEHICAAS